MKKRLIKPTAGIVMCSILTVSLIGCGGNNSEQISAYGNNSLISSTSTTETVAPTTEPPKEYAITNATVFSDGYAWVYLKDVNLRNYKDKENQQTACINKSGEIQFFLDLENFDYQSQSSMWSDYKQDNNFWHSTNANFWGWHDGTSLVHDTFGPQRIYDTKGNLIFETDDTYYKVVCYADGYYAVLKQIKSIDKNDHYVCFLNTDGTWKTNEWKLNPDSNEKVSYKGEDVFCCDGEFYDLQSNKVFGNTGYDNAIGYFSNGKMIFSGSTHRHCILDKQGNISEPSEPFGDIGTTDGFNLKSDIAVLFSEKFTGDKDLTIKRTMWFFSSKTNETTEIVSYTNGIEFKTYNCMFDRDKVVICLKGVDQEYYFTTYSQDGKQLYEPIQCDDYDKIWSACDRILIKREGKYFIYDYNGNLIFDEEKTPYQHSDFHQYSDDAMLIKYSIYNFQYLDKNGNILFDKLSYQNIDYTIVNDK